MQRYLISKYSLAAEMAPALARFAADYGRGKFYAAEDVAPVLVDIVAQARILTRISLDECNGIRDRETGRMVWNDETQSAADYARQTAVTHVRKDVERLFGDHLLTLDIQTDPRGAPIRVTLKDGREFLIDGGYQ